MVTSGSPAATCRGGKQASKKQIMLEGRPPPSAGGGSRPYSWQTTLHHTHPSAISCSPVLHSRRLRGPVGQLQAASSSSCQGQEQAPAGQQLALHNSNSHIPSVPSASLLPTRAYPFSALSISPPHAPFLLGQQAPLIPSPHAPGLPLSTAPSRSGRAWGRARAHLPHPVPRPQPRPRPCHGSILAGATWGRKG